MFRKFSIIEVCSFSLSLSQKTHLPLSCQCVYRDMWDLYVYTEQIEAAVSSGCILLLGGKAASRG